MFIKIPNYYIDTTRWTQQTGSIETNSFPFMIVNTNHIVSIRPGFIKYINHIVYVLKINMVNGKEYEFRFLDGNEVYEYIQMLTKRTEMVIE